MFFLCIESCIAPIHFIIHASALFYYFIVAIVNIVVNIQLFCLALLRSCRLPCPKNFIAQYDPVLHCTFVK